MRALSLSYRTIFLAIGVVGLMLSGCGKDGSDGAPGQQGATGEQGPPGPTIGPVTGLNITVTGATVVFNNTVSTVGDLRGGRWEVPASESWHAALL